MSRGLAAILVADIVGYSKMMGENEADALASLNRLREETVEPAIRKHRGRVVKQMGDGWLARFGSTIDAVNCAVAIQNDQLSKRTRLRIGVHLGDVIENDDGDIFGEGVNLAARLEAFADPGGVAISDQVIFSLDNRGRKRFHDCGAHRLKNISRSVRIWHWPKIATGAGLGLEKDDPKPVILVEKFNHSGDTGISEELAEELRSELLDSLARRAGIRLATSARGTDSPTYVMNGRCHVHGDRCRLYLSMLVEANGETFWSQKIDGVITNPLDFLDRIVGRIDIALRAHFNTYAGAAFASVPNDQLNVQQLLAKAAFFIYHFDARNAEISREVMATALARAPENPMVLAMQSYALMQTVPLAIHRVDEVEVDEISALADRAVSQGPDIDFVFHNRAKLRLWLKRDYEGCRADARRIIQVNPNYHFAKEDLASADLFESQEDSGLQMLETLIDEIPSEPITPFRLSILSIGHLLRGNAQPALRYAREGYERKPFVPIHMIAYAAAMSLNGQHIDSGGFHEMIENSGLTLDHARRFPLRPGDSDRIVDLLRIAGVKQAPA